MSLLSSDLFRAESQVEDLQYLIDHLVDERLRLLAEVKILQKELDNISDRNASTPVT